MNTRKCMVIDNKTNEIITPKIVSCDYNQQTQRYDVTFKNGGTYPYGYNRITKLYNPVSINPNLYHISHWDYDFSDIKEIYIFSDGRRRYWHVCFGNGTEKSYPENELSIVRSCLDDASSNDVFNYLKQVASLVSLRTDDGTELLSKQYDKITSFIGDNTALASYLSPKKFPNVFKKTVTPIFPFGCNASQYKAVKNALENKISIIQGPPGTGKTQTILNIIANLLVQGKTVQVVSNNNSATANILEKLSLPKYGMDFMVASLGRQENKIRFIKNQSGKYPDLTKWRTDIQNETLFLNNLNAISQRLNELFSVQENLSLAKQELRALNLELKHYENYLNETGDEAFKYKLRRNLKSGKIMQLWQECQMFSDKNRKLTLPFKIKSFLQSVCEVIPTAPQTLLREHYRCHPKIINFCNQKFYGGELIIMTTDNDETDVLSVMKTVEGNHQRDHMNQRQIDSIKNEILPQIEYRPEDIGIIAPYNDQVDALVKELKGNGIDISTVHKFQGREKEAIILTTVDNEITDFTDDPYLLNVAISRARRKLNLVVSGNEQPTDSNIYDLISYIEYNNFSVEESKIYSVFDYLYSQYTESRKEFLKRYKKISTYDSENLMYALIADTIKELGLSSYGVVCRQPLNMLIRDPSLLNDRECEYAMNENTHLDFLIYNKVSKKPVLAIEVDGYSHHKEGTIQHERDKLKNHILELYNIPLLRFVTNGSGEKELLVQKLKEISGV